MLYVEPVGERGGAETVLYQLLRRLDRQRFEPIVAFLTAGPFVAEIQALGIATAVLPVRRGRHPLATAGAIAGLVRLIGARQVRLVHSFGEKAHIYGGLAATLTRRPEVWSCHGRLDAAFARSLLGRIAGRIPTSAIITPSQAVSTAIESWYPWLPPSRRIYDGVDLANAGQPDDRAAVRRELGLTTDQRLVGIVGRLQPWKGQHVFLEAAAGVAQDMPDVRFAVVGDALFGLDLEYRDRLHRLAEQLEIADRVIFTGFRSDVLRLMGAMDVLVHASTEPEPFGLVIAEAMALARPVIAADAGGPREIVSPGETGLLVPPGDAAALAAAIQTLLAQPTLAAAMGAAGRARAERLFGLEAMVSAIQDLYGEVMGDG